MIKIGIYGANGRMGKEITKVLNQHSGCSLVYSYSREDSNLDDLCKLSDVVIDFSAPLGTLALIPYAIKHNNKLLIGTTGFNEEQYSKLVEASKRIPILHAVNTSFLVNILEYLVTKTASMLGNEYDAEILEIHHGAKKDAPSGTALNLGRLISKARDQKFIPHDHQNGSRPDNAIGFSVIRGGNLPGEHQVMFIGPNDKLTISHQSQNRICYAEGAVKAALWLASKPKGLYNMQDIFTF